MMHGGAVCTIIDIASAVAIVSNDQLARKMVTASLNCNFYRASAAGDTIYVAARTEKIGRTVGFVNCEIYNAAAELLYNGNTVMSFLKEPYEVEKALGAKPEEQK